MVFFNYALRKLNAKIVYYGPGLCGKTTNLVWIHDHFEGGERGKMISLATEGDRTIFFDLLPLEIGSIRGMEVTLQLYTVPGQVHYNSTRQLVLRGADGVVFVADSQRAMQSSNVDSFKNLQENLLLQGISLDGFPHVLQFNKRDLKNLVAIEDLNDDLNHYSVPIFEATATEGVGVQETLEGIVKLVMRNLRQRYEGATAGTRTPGVEDPQVTVPGMPVTPSPGPTEVVTPETPGAVAFADEPTSVDGLSTPAEAPPASSIVEPIGSAEPPREEEPTAPEAQPASSIVEPLQPVDPAMTIDFSQSAGAEPPLGGPGGGFEDEVSTGVYDVNDDSAIDFDELKRLDAPAEAPEPPPAEEFPVAAEPPPDEQTPVGEELPPADLPEAEVVDTVAGVELPEIPDEAPAAFDLESTDAGLKTQDLDQIREHDPMGAFDFTAPPPDMDAVPDFELEEDEPAPVSEPEQEFEVPAIEPEVLEFEPEVPGIEPEVLEFEPDAPEIEPESLDIEPEASEFEPDVPEIEVETIPPLAVAEDDQVFEEQTAGDFSEAAPPQRLPTEGAYIDRIEAPSPFAPDPEAPRDAPEVLEALRATAETRPEEPVFEGPAFESAMEVPPEELAEDFIAEEPEAEFTEEAWEEPPEEEAAEEAIAEEPVAEFAADSWDEPADEKAATEAVAEEPWEETPEEEAAAEEPGSELAAEEPVEESVAEFAAVPANGRTAEELLAEVMAAAPAAEVVEEPWEEPTEEAAVAETMVEEPDTDFAAESWDEPPVNEVEAEAAAEGAIEEETNSEPEGIPDVSDEEADDQPPIEEEGEEFEVPPSAEVEEEEHLAPADAIDEDLFEATPQQPVVVGNEDPWTEEELSDVYRISEVERAEQAAAIEAATPRAVSVQAEDNQLHLRLQGSGAIVESGQVRALDIEVPVPGSWVGNKRVTLQLRLTLTPDTEDEDDGSGSPS